MRTKLDALFVENVPDARLGQNVRERKPLIARKADAHRTLNELGEGLGYDGPTTKKHAWYLLYRTSGPRISTVLAVAKTLGVKIDDLVK
ncbi:MAG: hypothetical protein ISR77_01005 [Pirellulaceae bacterium]|nr:hypothetical protein [Pirellulaceae bacterium]